MNFKKILFSIAFLVAGIAAFAQNNPIQVHNNTGCHYLITATATDYDCMNPCMTNTICVKPFSIVQLQPCLPGGTQVWSTIEVVPANEDCTPCSTPVNVSSIEDPCQSYPQMDSGTHCSAACPSFTVDYHNPNHMDIN